jgi:hypothetical protein
MYPPDINLSGQMAIISRPKLTGLGEHWGVQLFNGMVAHSTASRGQHLVSYQDFVAGKQVKTIRIVPPEQHQRTLQRIRQECSNPKPYHPLDNNCETFANRITGQIPESPQVKAWFLLTLVGFFCWAANAT